MQGAVYLVRGCLGLLYRSGFFGAGGAFVLLYAGDLVLKPRGTRFGTRS